MKGAGTVAAVNLEIGHHHQVTIGGLTFNVDTILSSVIAGLIVLGAAIYMARRASSGRPSKLQLAFETIVDAVQTQVRSSMGDVAPFVVPLAVTLFLYILIASWLELIPSGDYLKAPSGDINFTLALGLFVVVWVHAAHIKQKGLRRYLAHYKHGVPVIAPFLNAIEELVKPFTLALRVGAERRVEVRGLLRRDHPGVHLRPAHDPLLRLRPGARGRGRALTPSERLSCRGSRRTQAP